MFTDWLTAENKPKLICNGCGRCAEPIDRDVAIAIIAEIVDRFADLGQVDRSPSTAASAGRCLSVAKTIERAASAISLIDSQLRRLSVLDGRSGVDLDGLSGASKYEAAPGNTTRSLFESAARLGWTIKTLPEVCWRPPSAAGGFSAAEVTWIGLHQAIHCLEDAQLLSAQAGVPNVAERAEEAVAAALHDVSQLKEAERC